MSIISKAKVINNNIDDVCASSQREVKKRLELTIFSRHLQWLSTQIEAHLRPYDVGILIGSKAQEIGYKSINLTVRATGHVDPNISDLAVNLPAMLRGIRSTGATCTHISTDISDAKTPIATRDGNSIYPEELISIASAEGIKIYRSGGFAYDNFGPDGNYYLFGKDILKQLDSFADRLDELALINHRYGIASSYHTRSGGNHPRSIWDLVYILDRFDVKDMGINYDIGHMALEGALSSWGINLQYAIPHVRSVSLKDCMIDICAEGRKVCHQWKRAGAGMVQWKDLFEILLNGGFEGPIESQYEYDVIGLNGLITTLNNTYWADDLQFLSGNLTNTFMTEEMRHDLEFYESAAADAGWSQTT